MFAQGRKKAGSYNWNDESVFAKVVRLCNVRERTKTELRKLLVQYDIPEAMAETAIARASACGLVDELRFAEVYLRGKMAMNWGQYRIEYELQQYGISCDDLVEWLDGYPETYFSNDSEVARALQILDKFHSSSRDIRAARYRRLAQKGFAPDIIREALERFEKDA